MKILPQWAVLFACVCSPVLLAPRAAYADDPSSAAAPEQGVWQKHEYNFAYMGFTSTYSCDGLADKLKLLLIAAGARKDAKSQPGACASGFGRPDKFARASLTFYTLAPGSGDGSSSSAPANPPATATQSAGRSPAEAPRAPPISAPAGRVP